jgi:ribosomal protein L2
MLQPRIPLRRVCVSCRSAIQSQRSYAQVVDPRRGNVVRDTTSPDTKSSPQDRLKSATGNIGLRRYTPRTPGIRHLVRAKNEHLWRGRPLYHLTIAKKGQGKGGRNHTGRVVVRHRGRIRKIDFSRWDEGAHFVERIEYDPGRTAHIALVQNLKTKAVTYILAAEGMRAGDVVQSYRRGLSQELIDSMGGQIDRGLIASKTAYRGNCLQLGMIPLGVPIFNISLDAKSPGTVCRSAGTYGVIMGKGEDEVQKEMLRFINEQGLSDEDDEKQMSAFTEEQLTKFEKSAQYVTVKLSSGELRLFDKEAVGTIGVASNALHQYEQLGKAGRSRWLGIRPTVRGVAMNAVDHPHGGGRGKGKGNNHPTSPWGQPVSFLHPQVEQC